MGDSVGLNVGDEVLIVGEKDGNTVGSREGVPGANVGAWEGIAVGHVGLEVGLRVGLTVGFLVGRTVGN